MQEAKHFLFLLMSPFAREYTYALSTGTVL